MSSRALSNGTCDHGVTAVMSDLQRGDRMLLPCIGGPSQARLVHHPAPTEILERGGMYVLVDDGVVEDWHYDWIADTT